MLSSKSLNVLVVEDDPSLRAMYRAWLQLEGFNVVAVEDGVDALRHIELNPPAAIVLDLGLPRLPGRDVHREIVGHSETRGTPIVIVTGGEIGDLNPGDFVGILRKPLDPHDLVSAVLECLRKAPV